MSDERWGVIPTVVAGGISSGFVAREEWDLYCEEIEAKGEEYPYPYAGRMSKDFQVWVANRPEPVRPLTGLEKLATIMKGAAEKRIARRRKLNEKRWKGKR